MRVDLEIVPLARLPECIAPLAAAFRRERPEWYGPGGRGDAELDLTAFAASETSLPVGMR